MQDLGRAGSAVRYKRIVVVKRGPPENLRIEECDLREPAAKEVRIKVLAAVSI